LRTLFLRLRNETSLMLRGESRGCTVKGQRAIDCILPHMCRTSRVGSRREVFRDSCCVLAYPAWLKDCGKVDLLRCRQQDSGSAPALARGAPVQLSPFFGFRPITHEKLLCRQADSTFNPNFTFSGQPSNQRENIYIKVSSPEGESSSQNLAIPDVTLSSTRYITYIYETVFQH
jgi:hypothetical protein